MLVRLCMIIAVALMMGGAGNCCFAASLNEYRLGGTTGAYGPYVEIKGEPGESLSDLTFLIVDGYSEKGVIYRTIPLTGKSIPLDSNYYVFGGQNAPSVADFTVPGLNFLEEGTALLVAGFSGALYDDLDTNDDGTLDVTPWTSIIDSVAMHSSNDPSGHVYYSANQCGPPSYPGRPVHAYRLNDIGDWTFWDNWNSLEVNMADSPGEKNSHFGLNHGTTGSFSLPGIGATVNIMINTFNDFSYGLRLSISQSDSDPAGTYSGSTATSHDSTVITPDSVSREHFYTVSMTPAPTPGTVTYSISLDTAGLSGINAPEKLVVLKRDDAGSPWQPFNTTLSGGTVTAAGLTAFSEFAVGSSSAFNPLPVALSGFQLD